MQSRRSSLIEAATHTAIGYLVGIVAQAVIFPAFGVAVSAGQHVGIAASFTAVSLARTYVIRRFFARRQ
jgi:hypothetical protein